MTEKDIFDWLLGQSPAIVVLALVAWDLRRNMVACITNMHSILLVLLERDTQG